MAILPAGQITNISQTGIRQEEVVQTWIDTDGPSGDISAIVRDSSGNITSYTEGTTAYTISYNADGTVNTVSGGGETTTVSYSGGEVSEVTYS